MKKIIPLILIAFVFANCKSKKTVQKSKPAEVVTIAPAKVDVVQQQKAYDLGRRLLMTCNTSKFKPFSASEATESVRRNTTEERLTKTCLKFRLKYGDFKDLKLMEVINDPNTKINTYRFKADYSREIANKELRIMMNENSQISAIKSLDWVETYKP